MTKLQMRMGQRELVRDFRRLFSLSASELPSLKSLSKVSQISPNIHWDSSDYEINILGLLKRDSKSSKSRTVLCSEGYSKFKKNSAIRKQEYTPAKITLW